MYANADKGRDGFGDTLSFRTRVIPYDGDAGWVASALVRAKACLVADGPPVAAESCGWCEYVTGIGSVVRRRRAASKARRAKG